MRYVAGESAAFVAQLPVGGVHKQQAAYFVGVPTREVFHVQATQRVADQNIRRLDASLAQLGPELLDDRRGVPRSARA